MNSHFILFAGTASAALGAAVARELGMPLGKCAIERFPDGEIAIQVEEAVRRKEIFLIQSTSPPVDPNLIELLAFVDACRRAAAGRITAIVPYFGYARSDKRSGHREPITASLVAALLQTAGVDQIVTIDLHADQIEGFFRIPVDNLTSVPTLNKVLHNALPPGTVVVSPDTGRVRMASKYAQGLGTQVIVLHKQRLSGSKTHITHVVGEVKDRPCLIIDDMIATGGTLVEAVTALRHAGARPGIMVAATHGLFLADAHDKLMAAGISALYVTDTVLQVERKQPPLLVVSVAPLIATAIRHLMAEESLASLY